MVWLVTYKHTGEVVQQINGGWTTIWGQIKPEYKTEDYELQPA